MSEIFLSYASADRPRIQPLLNLLAQQNWKVWWDRTIPPGQTWDRIIEQALDNAKCVIVLWSQNSICSDWVLNEAHHAKDRNILVPALLDDVKVPLAFRRIQAASLVGWTGQLPHPEIEQLLGAVSIFIPPKAPQAPKAGETRINPADGLTYIWIPPGSFTMGCSPDDTECHDSEKPPRVVHIEKGFWFGQTQVTQAAWMRVMNGLNPSHFEGDRLPVETVSWKEACEYCRTIGGRLPSEEEWEYAARAGTHGARFGDLDTVAWYNENSADNTHPVGLKQPNAWDLYDTLGNVWEWTESEYDEQTKVVRGGSWNSSARNARASVRYGDGPAFRDDTIGFRCVWELR